MPAVQNSGGGFTLFLSLEIIRESMAPIIDGFMNRRLVAISCQERLS
jgi:hypothetical protein